MQASRTASDTWSQILSAVAGARKAAWSARKGCEIRESAAEKSGRTRVALVHGLGSEEENSSVLLSHDGLAREGLARRGLQSDIKGVRLRQRTAASDGHAQHAHPSVMTRRGGQVQPLGYDCPHGSTTDVPGEPSHGIFGPAVDESLTRAGHCPPGRGGKLRASGRSRLRKVMARVPMPEDHGFAPNHLDLVNYHHDRHAYEALGGWVQSEGASRCRTRRTILVGLGGSMQAFT